MLTEKYSRVAAELAQNVRTVRMGVLGAFSGKRLLPRDCAEVNAIDDSPSPGDLG